MLEATRVAGLSVYNLMGITNMGDSFFVCILALSEEQAMELGKEVWHREFPNSHKNFSVTKTFLVMPEGRVM